MRQGWQGVGRVGATGAEDGGFAKDPAVVKSKGAPWVPKKERGRKCRCINCRKPDHTKRVCKAKVGGAEERPLSMEQLREDLGSQASSPLEMEGDELTAKGDLRAEVGDLGMECPGISGDKYVRSRTGPALPTKAPMGQDTASLLQALGKLRSATKMLVERFQNE
ncbi:hypothetical protein PIB30_018955 [Stylosanthes scabra]|uniref:Uncharacterized protein n=1 Tax=Stylosanthes scabra TaxID=79078 RepID=A0ABU6Z5H3_9FABA|nr:hypothetical protein [Stylosanthes scabra]